MTVWHVRSGSYKHTSSFICKMRKVGDAGHWIPPTPLFLVSAAADSWAPATVKIRGLDKLGTDLRRASGLCNHLMRSRTPSVYMFITWTKRAEMPAFMYVFGRNGRCVQGGE